MYEWPTCELRLKETFNAYFIEQKWQFNNGEEEWRPLPKVNEDEDLKEE